MTRDGEVVVSNPGTMYWMDIFCIDLLQKLYCLFEKTKNKGKRGRVGPFLKESFWGSGCSSVGRAVASDTRGPRFESSHRQNFISNTNCIEKTKIKKERSEMAEFLKKILFWRLIT